LLSGDRRFSALPGTKLLVDVFPDLWVDNGGVLAWINAAAVVDFAAVDDIGQKVRQRCFGERAADVLNTALGYA
jgi:hypothetical protein